MTKVQRSIDGFVLQRRDPATGPDARRVFMDSGRAVTPTGKSAAKSIKVTSSPEPKLSSPKSKTTREISNKATDDLSTDLEESLNDLGFDQQAEEASSVEQNKLDKKTKRRQRKTNKKAKKLGKNGGKRWPAKRIVKWVLLSLLILFLVVGGYLLVKSLIAGGKVFQGNVIDALTTKTRLAEDSNGRTNIVVFGTSGYTIDGENWDGGALTDSIMVISVDQDKHDAYMISLPRDLYVKHTCKNWLGTTSGKLNETYKCAFEDNNEDEDSAAAALRKTAGEVLGLDVQYYVHADWTAVTQSVDAIGGVDVVIESDDPRGIYDPDTKIKYANGEEVHLDGERALALSRARGHAAGSYGLSSGNYAREQNQQKILVALQKKALSAGTLANPAAVNSLLDAIGNNLRTNFKTSEIQTLIDLAKNINSENIVSLPLIDRPDGGPNLTTSGNIGGASVELPAAGQYNYSDIRAYIAQNLTSDPVVKENALIDVLNGSGVVGLAQTKADEIEEAKFRVGQVTNAPNTITETVKIYQLNPNKTATAAALQEKFGVQPIGEPLAGHTTEADFVIVFGPSASD